MGQAISRLLAREGASIVVADIDPVRGDDTVDAIKRAGGVAMAVRTDVSKSGDVERMVEATIETFGKVSILINHAGSGRGAPIEQMTEEMWDSVTGVHL